MSKDLPKKTYKLISFVVKKLKQFNLTYKYNYLVKLPQEKLLIIRNLIKQIDSNVRKADKSSFSSFVESSPIEIERKKIRIAVTITVSKIITIIVF